MKAIIVGGGIGGLAAAAALHQRNWQVDVLERAPAFTEIGAGLSIQPNGLRALDAIGLGEVVRTQGSTAPVAGIRHARGQWLIRNDTDDLERRYGAWATVYRADLVDLLRRAVPAASLHPGVEVRDVAPDGTVTHSQGTSRADLIVGADGLHSATRRSLWPHAAGPRYVGYTTWRLTVPPQPIDGSIETWGDGARFGFLPMPDGRVYCYAMANARAHTRVGLAELCDRFARWHTPIPGLLQSGSDDALLQHDTYELPRLPTYVSGNAAVLGDAAHAMTPNLGQGACQALEDAVTLAQLVDIHGVDTGLRMYDRTRRPRTQTIVRRSRHAGAPAHWTSPLLTAIRNTALPRLPTGLVTRSFAPTYTWTP